MGGIYLRSLVLKEHRQSDANKYIGLIFFISGNWQRHLCIKYREFNPCYTINLCPADRHDKAEKSVKLFVIICHLQVTPICVLKVLIEHRLSVFLPLLPRILSLSLNLSLRHRMYNCIHHRVVSPHLSLQHEKLPRTLNLSSISSSLPQTRPTFTPSPFVSETHCSSASTWCQESCGYRIDKHHCIIGKF